MGEENTQSYISILFDLKSPTNYNRSAINSIVLLLKDISDMEEFHKWDEIDTHIYNDKIEKMKNELDNLKIIRFKEDE